MNREPLVTGTLKWGLSPLDYREHLIDEWGDHPIGVLKALCGHRLMMITPLLSLPACKRCEACMAHLAPSSTTADYPASHIPDRPPVERLPSMAPGGRSVPPTNANR
ncbi:MAG: hypothetical protein ACRDS0_21620 [Pseudonocardiaceae bacterium]